MLSRYTRKPPPPKLPDNLINSLTNKGYNPSKLPINEKGLIPVSFDNFSNRKDAVIALRKFQNSDNKDAWIFDVE